MAAKKTSKRKVSLVKKSEVISDPWYKKYSYTRGEVLYRLAWLALIVFIIFHYKNFLIAATVNGEPISRLSIIQQLEKQQGSQVLDNLINETLIRQQAKAQNIIVSEDDKNNKIGQLETDLKGQGQDLNEILTSQGMTREQLASQIELQIMAEKLLESSIAISDEDVSKYLEENKALLPEGKSEEELKTSAREQLKQQKLSESFNTWLQDQRNKSKIERFVKY